MSPAPVRFLARAGHRPRRRRWPWIAGGALAVAAGGLWFGLRKPAEVVTYRSVWVERGDLAITVSAPGEVQPQNRIQLKPPLAGRIDEILVREGDAIRKGQILAWISSSDRAAVLDAARAKGPDEVRRWEDAYKPTPLVAPLDGFIIARKAEPGQTIGGGDSPLVMADRLIVKAQVDETDLAKVRRGKPCTVTLDAYPDLTLPGRVDHIAYEATTANNVTVYDIEIELTGGSDVLRSGMTATANVIVDERRHVLTLTADALTEQNGVLGVLTPRTGAAPVLTAVELGLADGARVEVRKGLTLGATVWIASNAVPPAKTAGASPFMPNWNRGGGTRSGGARRR